MRGVTDIGGLRDIRSHRSIGRRSIPKFRSSAYLELYMLGKARDRLEKELALLEKRRTAIGKGLSEIRREMEALERLAQSEPSDNGAKKAAEPSGSRKKSWKTFALKY